MYFQPAFQAIVLIVPFLCLLGHSVVGSPTPFNPLISDAFFNGSLEDYDETQPLSLNKRAGPALRIMPLGASIVFGHLSSTGNGFRKPLRDQLRYDGWEVNMVGTKRNGDMKDNDVEAHSGDVIDDVRAASKLSLAYKPNVVIINAGTNDAVRSIDVGNAGARMRVLIEELLGSDGWDRTTFILSTLIPAGNGVAESNRGPINTQYRNLVSAMRGEGKRVVLADMDPPSPDPGQGWLSLSTDYSDDIHPNDGGYRKMAYVWWKAINDAYSQGFIQEAYSVDLGEAGQTCDKVYGNGVYAGGLTQRGSGEDDGTYGHKSQEMGIVLTIQSAFDRDQWFFARLYSRERDDLVGWFNQSDGKVLYGTWRNTGDSSKLFVKIADMDVSDNCIPRGVHFIDLNGDGLDDFVCVGPGGDAFACINNGDGTDTKPPTFKSIGKIKTSEADQAHVRLADIDGDGRGDYCIVTDSGDVTCWRNGWIDDVPKYWQALGTVITNRGIGDIAGVRFEDINGDGRDDYLWVGDVGQTYTWTSSRSCLRGTEGNGLHPVWRQGHYDTATSGPTHAGMGGFADSGLRKRIHFARIYGEPQDFGLLGRQDYVLMQHTLEDSGSHRFDVRVWKNIGSGGTKIRADGNRYCNMLGHPSGADDYVWILSHGAMRVFENQGMKSVSDSGPNFWGANYVIFDPRTDPSIMRSLDRRDLHLVDWDGDGACDIVWTDPDQQNRVRLWRNKVKQTGKVEWEYNANPAPALYCPETRSIGFFDRPVQFGDITGNGRGDYICLEKDGRSWGFVHNDDGSWEYIDQYKFSEGLDRANLRWADVNGDGQDDMIWIDKFNGDGTVWYNQGRRDIGGSRFWWNKVGAKYSGAASGSCTYYPDLDGNGRADQHVITNSLTNTAETWFNNCGSMDSSGDDADGVHDPNLPIMPGSGGGGDGGGGGGNNCIAGTGSALFAKLCEFTCHYDYCPTPCRCTEWGAKISEPDDNKPRGYPLPNLGSEYMDMCSWSCKHGFCPNDVCTYTLPGVFAENPGTPSEDQCTDPHSWFIWKCHFKQCFQQLTGATRWEALNAQECLTDMADWFRIEKHTGDLPIWMNGMPAAVGGFFGGLDENGNWLSPENYACELIGTGSCDVPVQCGRSDYAAVDVVQAAFSNLHNFYTTLYDGVVNAEDAITVAAADIASNFIEAKAPSGLEVLKEVLGGLGLILQIAGAGVWEKILKEQAFQALTKVNEFATGLHDSVGSALDYYSFFAGEEASGLEQTIADMTELQKIASALSASIKSSTSNYLKFLFDGSDFGIEALRTALDGGVFIRNPLEVAGKSVEDVSEAFQASMKGMLMRQAWSMGTPQTPMLIVYEGETDKNPSDFVKEGAVNGDDYWVSNDLASKTRLVHQGYTMWLVGVRDPSCNWGTECQRVFKKLKGFDKIADYGLSWEDIAFSAFDGWYNNGKKNPYDMGKASELGGGDPNGDNFLPMQGGIKTPGYFNFPVCDIKLAVDNFAWRVEWDGDKGLPCDYYPCCPQSDLD